MSDSREDRPPAPYTVREGKASAAEKSIEKRGVRRFKMNILSASVIEEKNGPPTAAERVSNDAFVRLRELNRKRRSRRTLFSLLFAAAVAVVFTVGSVSIFFKVKTVLIEGSTAYSEEEIRSASGIRPGQNLYELDKAAIERSVIAYNPYIRNVRVDRRIPTTVALIVEEDEPRYYFEIAGEYFVLSDSLRVMERTEDAADLLLREPDIIKLNTQRIVYAVVGKRIEFENSGYLTYAEEMLSTFLGSELSGRISLIDFSNKFDIFVYYDGRLKIEFGNIEKIAAKINFASRIIETFEGDYSGTVNVENDEAFVILN